MIRADGHLTVSPQMRTRWTQAPNQPLGASPSHPAEWTPELAFLTSSQLALMSSWPEEPSRQNLPGPSSKPEGQKAGHHLPMDLLRLQRLDHCPPTALGIRPGPHVIRLCPQL